MQLFFPISVSFRYHFHNKTTSGHYLVAADIFFRALDINHSEVKVTVLCAYQPD